MMVRFLVAVSGMVGLASAASGCMSDTAAPAPDGRHAAGHYKASAELKTGMGASAGTARVEQVPDGLKVSVTVEGLTPGVHGAHVHTTGKCDAPDFTTAGGHWNPTAHKHGARNPEGPHVGDLPNLTVGANGKGTLTFTLKGGTYDGLLDQDGAAMVIHAGPDDLMTDPAGNSGGRIACGVFAAL